MQQEEKKNSVILSLNCLDTLLCQIKVLDSRVTPGDLWVPITT